MPHIFVILLLVIAITPSSSLATGMQNYDIVKLQSLNKATARTMTFEAPVGKTVKFGPLYIRPQICQEPPATERPESASFLQIWQVPIDEAEIKTNSDESEWVFSGWMFASSPGLSSMDHPVYDVWVLDCMSSTHKDQTVSEANIEENEPVVKLDGTIIPSPVTDTPTPSENGSDIDFGAYDDTSTDEPTVRLE